MGFRGLQGGWLDRSYRNQADRMREAALGKVDKFGLVQDVCGAPDFESPGTAVEGQAFFLLMESAAREYDDQEKKAKLSISEAGNTLFV